MISFTCCPVIDMERLFWFSLLLTYLPVTESMENADSCLSQPDTVISQKPGQSVVLPCTVSPRCSDNWDYEWFSFKESSSIRIKPLENPLKYGLEGASLRIKSLQANDSGIYHCAVLHHGVLEHGKQHVGSGTTLVVRERFQMTRHILPLLLFSLLAIYSLVILTLIIKKCGCRKKPKTEKTKKTSTKKTQFRDVLQEMYMKRNFERRKQAVSRNVSEVEAGQTDNNISSDDIYQNV